MHNEDETENPNRATAVINTLIAVTSPAPSLLVSLSDIRLDTTVPHEIIMVTIPAYERDTSNCSYIVGHAEPSKESGSPRLIKAIYMIISRIEYIYVLRK
jgi:hypothetical protein